MSNAYSHTRIEISDKEGALVSVAVVQINDVALSYNQTSTYWETENTLSAPFDVTINAEGFVLLELTGLSRLPGQILLQKAADAYYYFDGIPTACIANPNTWLVKILPEGTEQSSRSEEQEVQLLDPLIFEVEKVTAQPRMGGDDLTLDLLGVYLITARQERKEKEITRAVLSLRRNSEITFVEPVVYNNSVQELPTAHLSTVVVNGNPENQDGYEKAMQKAGFETTPIKSVTGVIRWKIELEGTTLDHYNEQIALLIKATAPEAVDSLFWGIE